MRRRLLLAGLAAPGLAAAQGAPGSPAAPWAQGSPAAPWAPTRPIRIVVGFSAGGGTDITTRALAARLQASLGQPIVVENRPGASGNLASEAVLRAPPDGHTLLMGTIAALAINPTLFRNLGFDPRVDFSPISLAGDILNVFVCAPEKPFGDFAALLAAARARPDSLSNGHSGVGGTGHLAGALLDAMAGIRTIQVSYRGGGALIADIISGKVDFSCATASTTLPHIESGRLRALAVPTPGRSLLLPQVPAVAESLPGYAVANWNALVGPRGMPPAVVARLNAAMREALADPEVAANLRRHGVEPSPSSPEELARFIREETDQWAPVIRASGATVD